MKTYALIGSNLKNTFSADFFNKRFLDEGVDAVYVNKQLAQIEEVKQIMTDELCMGFNVTMPFKTNIIPYLDELDDSALQCGAVNTVARINNSWKGFNTDIYGFEKSILPLLKPWHQKALILGNGGVTKAAVAVMRKLGIKYTIVSRNVFEETKEILLYQEIDLAVIRSHQLIIQCTPLGMYPSIHDSPDIPFQFITAKHLCFDMIYTPEKTAFLRLSEQQGATIKNGIQMLHLQAERAWEIWKAIP